MELRQWEGGLQLWTTLLGGTHTHSNIRTSTHTLAHTCVSPTQVFVGENKDWKLGVVTESAQRKGLFDMSPSNGYYAIWWSGSQLRALTAPPLTKVRTADESDCKNCRVTQAEVKLFSLN